MEKILNYINGELIEPKDNIWLDNFDPATGKVYGKIPASNSKDVNLAVNAAEEALDNWQGLKAGERAKFLYKISELIGKNLAKLALAESIDNGKPLKLATQVDIPRAKDNFHFFASAIEQFSSESHITSSEMINFTLRKSTGVVACISPWNLPLYLFSWKIAPALAAGCTVVAKPSEITPVTAFLLSEICIEAGLPAGVLNIVHGNGQDAGANIISNPKVKAISFTGGTNTGKYIAQKAAPLFKKLSLELGGKNPTIIFDDCDFEKALKTTTFSAFANQGQICLCGSRILVQRGIYNRFRDALVQKVNKLTVGDPLEKTSKQGALVSKPHFDKVLSYIELAKQEGGEILTGGESVNPGGRCQNGWFIKPTLIEGLPQNCRTNTEEIFGPVATIMPFDTEEEAISIANGTEYGLATSVWTQDISKAYRVSNKVDFGIVWINCWLQRDLRTPFGGMKSSGVGREGGLEALRFFTEPKNICVQI